MTIEAVRRKFIFNGAQLDDPSVNMNPDEVLEVYAMTYPSLLNGSIEGPVLSEDGEEAVYTLIENIGKKG